MDSSEDSLLGFPGYISLVTAMPALAAGCGTARSARGQAEKSTASALMPGLVPPGFKAGWIQPFPRDLKGPGKPIDPGAPTSFRASRMSSRLRLLQFHRTGSFEAVGPDPDYSGLKQCRHPVRTHNPEPSRVEVQIDAVGFARARDA